MRSSHASRRVLGFEVGQHRRSTVQAGTRRKIDHEQRLCSARACAAFARKSQRTAYLLDAM